MTPLPQRIEQVFQRHDHKYATPQDWRKAVIADLVALYPQPSRENARELIIRTVGEHEAWLADQQEGVKKPFPPEPLVDRWMTWATTHPQPIWCHHWEWDGKHSEQEWKRAYTNVYTVVPKDTRFCDRCGAPRPT